MIADAWRAVTDALGIGLEPKHLSAWNVSLRAVLLFAVGIVLVRVGNKRFLGKSTPFDMLVAVMLGAVLARAINGSSPVGPTIAGSAVLVLTHRLVGAIAVRSAWFSNLVKGHRRTLVEGGAPKQHEMRRTHFSKEDLEELLRLDGGGELADLKAAYLERNGEVSFVHKDAQPRVLDVRVEQGVQTVRIELKA